MLLIFETPFKGFDFPQLYASYACLRCKLCRCCGPWHFRFPFWFVLPFGPSSIPFGIWRCIQTLSLNLHEAVVWGNSWVTGWKIPRKSPKLTALKKKDFFFRATEFHHPRKGKQRAFGDLCNCWIFLAICFFSFLSPTKKKNIQVLPSDPNLGVFSGPFSRGCWWPPFGESKGRLEEAGLLGGSSHLVNG